MRKIDESLLDQVSDKARQSERLRMNHNFHTSIDENIQRMLNALEPDTYLPPHRHSNPDKEEIFLVLKGRVLLIEFDDMGNINDYFLMDPQTGNYAVEIKAGIWHTLISLDSGTVIYEIKNGPFTPISSDNIAPWSPESGTEKINHWISEMINKTIGNK